MANCKRNFWTISTCHLFLASQLLFCAANLPPCQATDLQFDKAAQQLFDDHFARGEQLRLNAHFVDALPEYGAVLKVKDDAKTHIRRGDIFVVLDNEDEAIAEYQAAAKLGDSVDIEWRLGKAYQLKKDSTNAIATFERALKLDPNDQDVQDSLVKAWSDVLVDNPMESLNHLGLGQALQRRGDFGQAASEYIQARDLTPGPTGKVAAQMLKDVTAVIAQLRAQAKAKAKAQAKTRAEAKMDALKNVASPDRN